MPPAAAAITIRDTVALLDGPFASFAQGLAEDRYVFWLGSGISLGRVPGLLGVIGKVVEFIRQRIKPGDPNCRFAQAMEQVLSLAVLSPDERARSDLSQPFATWPDRDAIARRLQNNYARLLDVNIQGEPFDYLLWEAVDVRATYGHPTTEPDVEHLCIGVLTLEGVASELVSANWDGLIEKAIAGLTGRNPALAPSVSARPVDLQLQRRKSRLIKFHGCAVLAGTNEAGYRPFLVARQAQIIGWCAKAENAPFVNSLVGLITNRPTLMLGLSAQDANIQYVFAEAAKQLSWPWPSDPPSYVFSEDQLGIDQLALLQNVYGQNMTPTNRAEIVERARIQAFAKPLLVALLLHVLAAKLKALVKLAPGTIPQNERQAILDGIDTLRNDMAQAAKPSVDYVNAFIDRWGRALQLVRSGLIAQPAARYQPLTAESVAGIAGNPDLHGTGLREAAVAVGLIGAGVSHGHWTVKEEESTAANDGFFAVTTPAGTTKVFITANPYTALQLLQQGHVVDADRPIVIQAQPLAPTLSRSPRGAPGRTGHVGVREMSIASLLQAATTFADMLESFRQDLAL